MNEHVTALDHLPRGPLARTHGPLYRQVANMLREPIGRGVIPIGDELPKEAAIAERLGVSLITVRQALRDLEADGLIRKRSAKPAVVVARDPAMTLSWTFKNFADIAAFVADAHLEVLSYGSETSPVLKRHFDMRDGQAGYCLRSLLCVGLQRKAHVTTYFPHDIGSRLKREDFDEVLIFRAVQKRLNIPLVAARCTIRAEIADAALAVDLQVPEGSAILAVEMVYRAADGRNVEVSIARHPAHLFSIAYDAPNDLT